MVNHKQDIKYKGQLISIYQMLSENGLPMDMYEVCVREGDGREPDVDDWKEPVFKDDWVTNSDCAIEMGKAFIDGMFHERANNQRNTNE